VSDILGLDSLFAELVLGIGAAILIGNGVAWIQHRRGRVPRGVTSVYRPGRAIFLSVIGLLMVVWGVASIASQA
jgi:hypothetical protein